MRWLSDLAIGVRLAVGGGRSSAARLVLSTVGIAVAVFVLLVGASLGAMSGNPNVRQSATLPDHSRADVAPTIYAQVGDTYRTQRLEIFYVHGTGPDSPKPAALPELPKPGEMYASAALVDLLRSQEGALLRPRLPDRVVGTLDQDMVVTPGDLVAWVGADETLAESDTAEPVYGFGVNQPARELGGAMLLLALIGGVVLLLPVFVFVSSASRIAGAERDRRLSALRLVGAGARQVRRIAAAESLVSAVAGLALGAVLFLVGRQFAEDVVLFGKRVYVSDVVPNPVLAAVIVLLIPALTVLTAMVALRRTIIEPLGVVRHSNPTRRQVWWRLGIAVLGVVVLMTQLGLEPGTDLWQLVVVAGAALVLIGAQVLLPWVIERVAVQVKGGPSSWLLAIRRLQLDSGTPARVVGGVAVVLAGTILLQTMLLTTATKAEQFEMFENQPGTVTVMMADELAPNVVQTVRNADGVRLAHPVRYVTAYEPDSRDDLIRFAEADCAALRDLAALQDCRDGEVFVTAGGSLPAAGTEVEFREFTNKLGENWDPENYKVTDRWTIPSTVRKFELDSGSPLGTAIFVTPGALETPNPGDFYTSVIAQVDKNLTANQMEGIRNALAEYRWDTYVSSYNTGMERGAGPTTYDSLRNALYAGSLFTLTLAGVSMLVLALEHIRERRRSLAVLAASGVPRGVLARSLLWQVALPIILGVAIAILTGTALAAMMVRLTEEPLSMDWPGVAVLSAGAVVLTLLVSAMTLPFLKNATRLTTIRTE